jgi:hypothetical protein
VRDAPVELEVRPVVAAADDVGDLELEVVDNRRELVRSRAVRPEESRAVAPEPDRSLVLLRRFTGRERALRGFPVERAALALTDWAFVDDDAEPLEIADDRLLSTRDAPLRVGVVDPQDEHAAALVSETPVGDRCQRIPKVERARRARREADPCRGHASIVT